MSRNKPRIPTLEDSVEIWFSCKVVNALHGARVFKVADIATIIGKMQEFRGIGRTLEVRLEELYYAATNGNPLPEKSIAESRIEKSPQQTTYDFLTPEEEPALPKATEVPPGSLEKIEVLRQRVSAGLALWHPDDAGNDAWNNVPKALLRDRNQDCRAQRRHQR